MMTGVEELYPRGLKLMSITIVVLCIYIDSGLIHGFETTETNLKHGITNASSDNETFDMMTSSPDALAVTNSTADNDAIISDDLARTNNLSVNGVKCVQDCVQETDTNTTLLPSTGTDLVNNVTTPSPNDTSGDNVISKTSEQYAIANSSAANLSLNVLEDSSEYNGSEAPIGDRNSSDMIKSDYGAENNTTTINNNTTISDSALNDNTTMQNNITADDKTTSGQYTVDQKNKSTPHPPHSTILKHHNHSGPHKHAGRHRLTKKQYEYLVRHFTGFMPNVRAGRPTPNSLETELELDDGPFGSILWRDKKYLVTVLIPIGVGITGAMLIIVMAYATRVCRRRKVAERNPRTLLQPSLSRPDDIMLLEQSSDDEF